MKTVKVIESANVVIKSVAAQLRNANKEYTSISSVLKDIQRTEYMKAGYRDVFAAVGVDVNTKLTPSDFFARLHETQWGVDKKGKKYVGVWGMKKQEDDTQTPVLRKVTSWTPRKVFMVLAQSIEAAK